MKVLITVASRHGATQEIAEALGQALGDCGLEASVSALGEIETLDGFDAVIVGSAVYMGRWLEPARSFVSQHSEALAARPTWLFSSGPVGDPPRPEEDDAVEISELVSQAGAKGHHLFAGKLDKSGLGLGERVVARAVGAAAGDFRDWREIESWATAIARELEAARSVTISG